MRFNGFFERLTPTLNNRVYIHIHRVYTTLLTVCIDGVERFGCFCLEKTGLKSRIHTIVSGTHEEI